MVRAAGSYPAGRWFESDRRYQQINNGNVGDNIWQKIAKEGPLVKRLRHHPFTVVTWVRVPYGSPKNRQVSTRNLSIFIQAERLGM